MRTACASRGDLPHPGTQRIQSRLAERSKLLNMPDQTHNKKMAIPTEQQCLALLRKNGTKENIVAHCRAVRDFAVNLAERLARKGARVDIPLVAAGALLHDVEKLRPNHVKAGHDFVKKAGYPEVAILVKRHGLENLNDPSYRPQSIEEKLVFYADKRVKDTAVTPLRERFDYIRKTYNYPSIEHEFTFAREIEEEFSSLLGESP